MSSSRYPGKPMIDLLGKPMIEHVYRRVKLCKQVDEVYVATCDDVIYNYLKSVNCNVVMTSKEHEMCMDRIYEAAQKVQADVYTVIQGDEPLIMPEMVDYSIRMLKSQKDAEILTLAQKIVDPEEIDDVNRVKMVWNKNNEVLYISREAIPSRSKTKENVAYYKMICVYTFYSNFISKFNKWGISNLERIESIDMLRIIENNEKLKVSTVEGDLYNIDVPEDVDKVIAALKSDKYLKEYL
jgi:3-deoxy-manno-octulosonate cytidylyltransferase (CMP-KDO synthetase)